MPSSRRFPLLAAGALSAAVGLHGTAALAQQPDSAVLRGRVLAAESGQPLPFAVLELPGTNRQVLTDAAGRFQLAQPPGPFTVRAEYLGYSSADTTLQGGGAGGFVELRLQRQPLELAAVEAKGEARECTRSGFTDSASSASVAALADEVRKNGTRFHVFAESFPFRERFSRAGTYLDDSVAVATRRDTVVQGSQSAYEPGGALVRREAPGGRTSYMLWGPSAYALSDPTFQASHCFRYGGTETLEGTPVYRVDIVPLSSIRGPDVRGFLLLDKTTLVLRRAVFYVVNLPHGLLFSDVRLQGDFHEIAPGLLVPQRIRTTERLHHVKISGRSVNGYSEIKTLVDLEFSGLPPATLPPRLRRPPE